MTDHILRTESDRARMIGYLQGLDLSKPKKITVKAADRSVEQNRLLHKLLSDVASQVEWHGQTLSVDVWKRLCTAAWLREAGASALLIPALDGQGFDLVFQHTSKLSVAQCGELIEWIQAFGAEHEVKWSAQDHWQGRY